MSGIVVEAARLMDTLPESEQVFAFEFIKKLVLAWDPDYTKTTAEEKLQMEKAEQSGYVNEEDIDWDNLSIYND